MQPSFIQSLAVSKGDGATIFLVWPDRSLHMIRCARLLQPLNGTGNGIERLRNRVSLNKNAINKVIAN